MRCTAAAVLAVLAACVSAFAEGPAFDAASVTLASPDLKPPYTITGGPGSSDPTRFRAPRIPLFNLLARAFGVSLDQIAAPAWVRDTASKQFTVVATMPPDTTQQQFEKMLQNLLVERFHFMFHHETRNFPGYELVVDKGGPKLREVAPSKGTGPADFPGTVAYLNPAPGMDFPNVSGPRTISLVYGGLNRVKYQERTMADFVSNLGFVIGSSLGKSVIEGNPQPRVVDRTGLTGHYTFVLEYYSAATAQINGRAAAQSQDPVSPANDPAD